MQIAELHPKPELDLWPYINSPRVNVALLIAFIHVCKLLFTGYFFWIHDKSSSLDMLFTKHAEISFKNNASGHVKQISILTCLIA